MHPLVLWAITTNELAERAHTETLLRARRDSGTEQPAPLTRDERWVAAIHRWAAQEQEAAPVPAPAPSTAPRMGCA